ncbi:MAG: bifunctional acetate--CoA ligase family protein/GNAT family N-acetyltransferase [Methylococcaceae bacterium]|nr:bifunctional acetate--CoA ligase family protein/GNAT family N-acetyltransferase [Methylococcaceae bacterium]MDP3389293.1 bifunctional acetate--CoA ligase family protein/GNAT family N-acetyltransferase [Methylococcaceae bacterium]MDP3932415.1 bifunctional acetate--CoA ligase family protein/GNAT family N-acetyltransferase [Methylococcaceae bacterium]MDZ4155644.1 bifunctional acetate--CoA ligase family protein/GNAT family N-acetyltransferase [Methylococcales bacterium]
MGPHYLNRFFTPKSVAIVGASARDNSVGYRLLLNMQEAGFAGGLYPINPKHEQLLGLTAYPDLISLPETPDLVVIATPAASVPSVVRQCGEKGVKSVVIISAGFAELGTNGAGLQQEVLQVASHFGIRIVGPNCLGIIRPSGKLNATFGDGTVKDGHLALLSQSGAICTAILDWAKAQDIGFSTVVSMGGAADIDFGEVLDYLATDSKTTGILMYVEGIRDARRFLSGLKAAARLKPVILIKSGRHAAGSLAAMSHTGAMVGGDHVFDAAIERAGVVRVYSINELFSAARVLANNYAVTGDRLAIITNAGGPGVMSTDRAEDVGIQLAELSSNSLDLLNEVLPTHWSHANPVDILGDATPDRYQKALNICLADDNIDGVLVILTPQAMTDPTQVAHCIIEAAQASKKPVLASWTGGAKVQEGRQLFADSRVAHFSTPEMAVDAFSFLTQYNQNQVLLKQIPLPGNEPLKPDIDGARLIIEQVLAEGRQGLTAQEAKAVLTAFNIPVTPTIKVHNAKEAMLAARTLGFPVVLKVDMAEFSHKSDIGGVKLNIASVQDVSSQFTEMEMALKQAHPEVKEIAMTVEPMFRSSNGRELIIGVVRDPVFGPAISFGLGGTLVEILKDNAVALPPLNAYMIEQLISKTKAAKYLKAFRQMPAAKTSALIEVLLNVSTLVSELPEILELDINPLIVDDQGAMAVDARIKAQSTHQLMPYQHMAIHPYPHELTERYLTANGIYITIRPIRPEDAVMEKDFVHRLSEHTKYFRFMQALQELTPEMVVRFTQIDYDREMAFVAVADHENLPKELGVGRYLMNPDGQSVEFALVVSDGCQRMGIGTRIMKALMQSAKSKGVSFFEGEVLAVNSPMLALTKKLGFTTSAVPDDIEVVRVVKDLRQM